MQAEKPNTDHECLIAEKDSRRDLVQVCITETKEWLVFAQLYSFLASQDLVKLTVGEQCVYESDNSSKEKRSITQVLMFFFYLCRIKSLKAGWKTKFCKFWSWMSHSWKRFAKRSSAGLYWQKLEIVHAPSIFDYTKKCHVAQFLPSRLCSKTMLSNWS